MAPPLPQRGEGDKRETVLHPQGEMETSKRPKFTPLPAWEGLGEGAAKILSGEFFAF